MKPPVRWRDDDGAPNGVRELLRAAPRSRLMPRDVRARSAARIDRWLVVPAAAGLLFWIKAVALAAGLAAVGAVAVVRGFPVRSTAAIDTRPLPSQPSAAVAARLRHPAAAAVPAAPAIPVASAASIAPDPVAPLASLHRSVTPALRQEESATPVATRYADPPTANPLEREAPLLESARASLDADPATALGTLAHHASEFPEGTLAIEREVLAVDALRRLGRIGEARERARGLLARTRGSFYERRIEAMIGAMPGP